MPINEVPGDEFESDNVSNSGPFARYYLSTICYFLDPYISPSTLTEHCMNDEYLKLARAGIPVGELQRMARHDSTKAF
jgi:hypothetical protein